MLDVRWRWKRFQWYEVVAKNRKQDVKYFSPLLLDRMELLGDRLEQRYNKRVRIIINDWYWGGRFQWRGFRTKWGNLVSGGRPGSFHLHGGANDYHSPDLTPVEIYPVATELFGGVILYESAGFLHSDIRNGPNYHVVR